MQGAESGGGGLQSLRRTPRDGRGREPIDQLSAESRERVKKAKGSKGGGGGGKGGRRGRIRPTTLTAGQRHMMRPGNSLAIGPRVFPMGNPEPFCYRFIERDARNEHAHPLGPTAGSRHTQLSHGTDAITGYSLRGGEDGERKKKNLRRRDGHWLVWGRTAPSRSKPRNRVAVAFVAFHRTWPRINLTAELRERVSELDGREGYRSEKGSKGSSRTRE
ncbi:hypothetical protein GGR52DRAFT_445352 [Hypoxylon sp. FL1284]|nr:hypothetical protein GGR52DRAFT_445352 [Hypoxylon sp. FL1284]